jgi:hypothetical protein
MNASIRRQNHGTRGTRGDSFDRFVRRNRRRLGAEFRLRRLETASDSHIDTNEDYTDYDQLDTRNPSRRRSRRNRNDHDYAREPNRRRAQTNRALTAGLGLTYEELLARLTTALEAGDFKTADNIVELCLRVTRTNRPWYIKQLLCEASHRFNFAAA